jgi:hypothetical protein
MSCSGALLTFLLCGGAAAAADAGSKAPDLVQPLSFKSRADPEQVQLGEPFSYELVIGHRPGQRYDLRPPSSDGAFELLGQSRNRIDAKDSATTTFTLKLALFELGRKKLPDLTFEVIEADRAGKFVAPGLEVEAVSSLAKESEKEEALRDIKPPEDVPVRSYRLLWVLASLVAVGALGYALYRWLKRDKPVRTVQEPKAPLDVRILGALDELQKQNLPAQGRVREFYFRLSEIVRTYLGERYGFEALECTSAELLQALGKVHAPGLPAEELKHFVAQADLVKFAKQPALSAQCEEALQFAHQLVKRTPLEVVEASEGLAKVVGAGVDSSHVNRSRLP